MHDPTVFLLGTTGSSAKEVTAHSCDPAQFPAGIAVSYAPNGDLSKLDTLGGRIGISLGKAKSDHRRTAVARSGEAIPVLLSDEPHTFVEKGKPLFLDSMTGKACDAYAENAVITDAIYASDLLDGITQDGARVKCALIDMPGGL